MLHDAKLDQKFWGAALVHSAFIRNACPSSAVATAMTPFEMVHGKPFDLSKLRKFGAKAFVHVERQHRSKFSNKARTGIYIGYALHSATHRVYVPETRRVIETAHAKFIENTAADQGELRQQQQPGNTTQVVVPVLPPLAADVPQGGNEAAKDTSGGDIAKQPHVPNVVPDHMAADQGGDTGSDDSDPLLSDFPDTETGFTAVHADPKTSAKPRLPQRQTTGLQPSMQSSSPSAQTAPGKKCTEISCHAGNVYFSVGSCSKPSWTSTAKWHGTKQGWSRWAIYSAKASTTTKCTLQLPISPPSECCSPWQPA